MTSSPDPVLLARQEIEGGVRIVLDGGEALEVAADALPEGLPEPGEPVPEAVLAALRRAAARKEIARSIFRHLDRRLRPLAWLRRRLAEEGYQADVIAEVLDQFVARGLHSDQIYAEAYCRDALSRRPAGRGYLLGKLREQGVAEDAAATAVARVLDPGREGELARVVAAVRWRRERGPITPQAEARVFRHLLGRGFPPAVARAAVRDEAPRKDEA